MILFFSIVDSSTYSSLWQIVESYFNFVDYLLCVDERIDWNYIAVFGSPTDSGLTILV